MDFEVVDIAEVEDDSRSFSFIIEEEENCTDELIDCNFCGSCIDPNTCVFGIVCPACGSGIKQLCRQPGATTRLVGLHEERWRAAKGREYGWR